MNIRQVYLTDDGCYFDTYEEALNYSLLLKEDEIVDELTLKDRDGRIIPLKDAKDELWNIRYIDIHTERALDYINMLFSNGNHPYQFSYIGEYRYIREDDEWIEKEEEFNNLKADWDIFS